MSSDQQLGRSPGSLPNLYAEILAEPWCRRFLSALTQNIKTVGLMDDVARESSVELGRAARLHAWPVEAVLIVVRYEFDVGPDVVGYSRSKEYSRAMHWLLEAYFAEPPQPPADAHPILIVEP